MLYKFAKEDSEQLSKDELRKLEQKTSPALGIINGKLLGSLIGGALAGPSGYLAAKARGADSDRTKIVTALATLGGLALGGVAGESIGGYKAYNKRKELVEKGILPARKDSKTALVLSALNV